MIQFKDILLEAMKPGVANTIFAKYGVRNAAVLDKGRLRKYYVALAKQYHSDVGGNDEDMKWINAAYDVLEKSAKEVTDVELKPEDEIVNIEFRGANGEVLDSGQCNHYELIEMMQKIKDEGITAQIDPSPFYNNVEEKWLVATIAIYMDEDEFHMVFQYVEPFFKH